MLACRIRKSRCRWLYGQGRINSAGLDLANEHRLASLSSSLLNSTTQKWQARPLLETPVAEGEMEAVVNPAEPKDIVGYVREATGSEVARALESAVNNAPSGLPPRLRNARLSWSVQRC
jgi:RHH-type proline utilization regulon transcriptional repressor/proline dehydrogenase/delta 1-pyrroline-5-carboxylate dehydrogenase